MIGRWMVAAALFSGGVVVGALLLETCFRSMRWPIRFVWVAAIAVAAVFPWWWTGPTDSAAGAVATTQVEATQGRVLFDGREESSQGADRPLLLVWLLTSALLLINRGVGSWRIHQRAQGWRRLELMGQTTWVSSDVGPALVGVVRPRIVVPEWLLEWGGSAKYLVLRHEEEHRRAGDAWLRLMGFLVVASQPWNVGLWYMARRMDLGIEGDCDARVLRHTSDVRPYAELLVEVARMVVPVRPAPAGFSHSTSRLERRLLMLTSVKQQRRYGRSAVTLVAAAAVTMGLQSCSRPESPTVDHVQALADGGAAEPEFAADGTLVLPGTPAEGRIAAELDSRYPEVATDGLPEDQSVWFLIDEDSRVMRSGIGAADGLIVKLQTDYPTEASDFALSFTHGARKGKPVNVLWVVPPPPLGSLPSGQ